MFDWEKKHDWVSSGWGFRATSNEALMYAISRIGTHQAGKRYVWRGVSDATHRMSSSLWREVARAIGRRPNEQELREREEEVFRRAVDWGLGAEQGIRPTEFHIAAILQHEGVPTRLLDVSSNPMTALWFACASEQDRPGVLFALEVSSWKSIWTTESFANTYGGLEGRGQLEIIARSTDEPFLLIPKNATGRLAAQEGLFLSSRTTEVPAIDGVDGLQLKAPLRPPGRDHLDEMLSIGRRGQGHPRTLPLVAVVIPSRVKRSMMGHLGTTYNRTRQSLFPDVGGFRVAYERNELG